MHAIAALGKARRGIESQFCFTAVYGVLGASFGGVGLRTDNERGDHGDGVVEY